MREYIDGEALREERTQLSSLPLLWDYSYGIGFPEVCRAKDAH